MNQVGLQKNIHPDSLLKGEQLARCFVLILVDFRRNYSSIQKAFFCHLLPFFVTSTLSQHLIDDLQSAPPKGGIIEIDTKGLKKFIW